MTKKKTGDVFNGIECVRFDEDAKKAYVSVGFGNSNAVYLRFINVAYVEFDSVAKYYDHRTATYTLSADNWGGKKGANPGAVWQGMENNASDKYQAAVHACRMYDIPISVAINSDMAGGAAMWARMQEELDYDDTSWEPAVHTRTHPCSSGTYAINGYTAEILGCRDDILSQLHNIPYGEYVFEFILPCGYQDNNAENVSTGEFLFVRDWDVLDHFDSTDYDPWNTTYDYYGLGGFQTINYDGILQARSPSPGRYYADDVNTMNSGFDTVYNEGGIFFAMFHPDRYENGVIYDTRTGVDGMSGSSLMQHWGYVAKRTDVWYVANGWLYSYRYVAENVSVAGQGAAGEAIDMTILN